MLFYRFPVVPDGWSCLEILRGSLFQSGTGFVNQGMQQGKINSFFPAPGFRKGKQMIAEIINDNAAHMIFHPQRVICLNNRFAQSRGEFCQQLKILFVASINQQRKPGPGIQLPPETL